jgi:myo-inositol-1(or 4)-monophosphatase
LADALLTTGIPHRGRDGHARFLKEMEVLMREVAGIRRTGSAALDLAFVAAGRFDGYWERNLKPWDMAAGIVIVREAGGIVTGLDGTDSMLETGDVIAANIQMHKALLPFVQDKAPQR